MTGPHKHRITAKFMMRLLDYDTFTIGCEVCGPQWVVTVNWYDCSLSISWANVDLSVYYDGQRQEFILQNGDGGGISEPLPNTEA